MASDFEASGQTQTLRERIPRLERLTSISNKFFEKLKERAWAQEIFYYRERCIFNSYQTNPGRKTVDQQDRENFLDQAHRLTDLLEQIALGTRAQKIPKRFQQFEESRKN